MQLQPTTPLPECRQFTLADVSPTEIMAMQSFRTEEWHHQRAHLSTDGFLRLVEENHLRNFLLWHEEDIARRDDLGSLRVHKAKRSIDRYNQQRNDAIEAMDLSLAAALAVPLANAPMHSETPGMIIDRLSILALRIYHLREESLRLSASEAHRGSAAEKLVHISEQRRILGQCLVALLGELAAGKRRIFPGRICKMYNDPSLNPELYEAPGVNRDDAWKGG